MPPGGPRMRSMVRFWLANRPTDNRVEAAFLSARVALAEQVAEQAGLEKFNYFDEEESLYWFEGTLSQVVQAVRVLSEQYALSGVGVEVDNRSLAEKWPVAVKVGGVSVSKEEIPGRGDRRLQGGRRQTGREVPEPNLESEMKRGFEPD